MSQPNEGQERIDYRETADITEVHAAISREHAEPRAGTMPIPMWLGALSAGALCWAGAYVGMFAGGFSPSVYNEYESSPAAFFPLPKSGAGEVAVELPLLELGKKTFDKNCSVCHAATGVGTPPNPPVAGSEWVDGAEFSEKRLVAILLKGISGPLVVNGKTYNGNMPPWGGTLKPREIAGVITYIRQSFGNKGTGEITEAHIAAGKKAFESQIAPWTEAGLKAIPLTDKLDVPAGDSKSAAAAVAPVAMKTDTGAPVGATPAAPAASTYDLVASIANGQKVYTVSCGACHQATGAGIPGAFPTLIATPYTTGDARRLTAIVLKGVTGPITVNGTQFTSMMPNPELTFPILKDDKNVADVLNYVRNSWGNKAEPVITPEFVTKVREEFKAKTDQWTEAELLNFPAAK
jgi:mono/diheme cytochrome c family protein